MTIGTISVNGTSFPTYGTQAELTAYANGSILPAGVTFTSDFTRLGQLAVTATRIFETLRWQGERVSTSQDLSWPRTGIVDRDGNALSGTPPAIFSGFSELAIALDQDATGTILSNANGSGNVRRQRDLERVEGAVTVESETEYFVPIVNGRNGQIRLPLRVHEYVRPWLQSGAGLARAVATGTDECSSFDDGGLLSRFGFTNNGLP